VAVVQRTRLLFDARLPCPVIASVLSLANDCTVYCRNHVLMFTLRAKLSAA